MTKVNEYDILIISNKERQKGVIDMKIVWVTKTTGRVYVSGNFIAYAHRDTDNNITYSDQF